MISFIKFNLILSVLIIFSYVAQSQSIVSGSDAILDKLRLNKSISGINNNPYSSIVGNPYLFENFQLGVVTLKSGESFKLDLRFDIYANEIHIKRKDQIYAIFQPEKVSLIEIDTLTFIYCDYKKKAADEAKAGDLYFLVISNGNCKLLAKNNIRIQDAELPKLYQDAKPAKFINLADTYYLKMGNNSPVQIDNKKDLLLMMRNHKDKVVDFINSEKLGIKKDEDLKKIISFYNSLH